VRFKATNGLAHLIPMVITFPTTLFFLWFALQSYAAKHEYHDLVLWLVLFFSFAISDIITLYRYFPRYFEIQDDNLVLREGRKRTLVPYAVLDKLVPVTRDSGFLPVNELLVQLKDGKSYRICVKEK
jgi:hypothetical protein